MNTGKPVSVLFTEEEGNYSDLLYCELIQKARYGESFLVKSQGCSVGAFVLGDTEKSPEDYYFSSKRYGSRDAAKTAASGLCRLAKKGRSIKITPYSGKDFDVLLLFLKPERAMRLVQAYTYKSGCPVETSTGGIASICSDCTAYPMKGKPGISPGCKGSRKHSRYSEDELVVGIPFQQAGEIDAALGKIPETVE
jgi:uncharacterized protein (DUF169 family)